MARENSEHVPCRTFAYPRRGCFRLVLVDVKGKGKGKGRERRSSLWWFERDAEGRSEREGVGPPPTSLVVVEQDAK